MGTVTALSRQSFDDTKQWRAIPDEVIWVIERATGWSCRRAPTEADLKEATDVIATDQSGKEWRIAVRLRQWGPYHDKYAGQFTARMSRRRVPEVEFAKIMAGLVDFMFYAFHNEHGVIHHFYMIELDLFRFAIKAEGMDVFTVKQKTDRDGVTWRAFDLNRFAQLGRPILWMQGWC